MMVRHDGYVVSEATVLRVLRDEHLILPAQHQRERRRLAERRKAVFAARAHRVRIRYGNWTSPGFETTTGRVSDGLCKGWFLTRKQTH